MIEISNLYKRYHNYHGSDWVLKNINLTIPTKTSVGLIGRNGAGKSTLLRLIGGMDAPDKGEIRRRCRVSWPIGLGGGFQGSMTGRQNVKFVARVHNHGADAVEIIKKVEEFAEIGDAFDEPVKTYSSGMRARLQFGLSLAFDFDVYLSDEATAVGDRAFKAKAKKAFSDRISQSSLIMVSHGEGILKEMCQAGIFLDKGEAVWFDDIREAIRAYHDAYSIKKVEKLPVKKAEKKARRSSPLELNRRELLRAKKEILKIKEETSGLSQRPAEIEDYLNELRQKADLYRNIVHQLEAEDRQR
ncbi:ABC transporter ATP-binding protein [Salinicola sp. 4072]|uniref:ABC transporter ATP-binding protein n=1 Tax=Salinicola sp. 4072 TaxID=3082157 RepID=UPI002FC834ED